MGDSRSSAVALSCVLGLAGLAGCGSSPPLTAEQHRQRAEQQEERAAAEEAQYDPDEIRRRNTTHTDFATESYNPTEHHLEEAEEHREHAQEHLAEANALDSFAHARCELVPRHERGLCPLLAPVTDRIERIDDGFVVHFRDDVDAAASIADVQCHVAFAAAHGTEGMHACMLYVPGLRAEAGADGRSIRLTVEDDDQLGELRRRLQQSAGSAG